MNFEVLVVIPKHTPEITGTIEKLMAPYNTERQVAPYRVYITDEEKALIAQRFNLPRYLDEQGDYYLSSINPQGYWDSWFLQDTQDIYELPRILMNGIDPHAVVTPDGLWHEMPYRWDESTQQITQRRQLIEQVLAQYTGHLAILLHCHH